MLSSEIGPLFHACYIEMLKGCAKFFRKRGSERIINIGNEYVVAHVGPVACNAGANTAGTSGYKNAMFCHVVLSSFV